MKTVYLIRHAESTANAGAPVQVNAEIALSGRGAAQAEDLADWLCGAAGAAAGCICVSSYLRTAQTARPFLRRVGREAEVWDCLHEFDYLAVERIRPMSREERRLAAAEYWQRAEPQRNDGGGTECFHDFVARVSEARRRFEAWPSGVHLVFTHGVWLAMLVWLHLGQAAVSADDMRRFRRFEKSLAIGNTDVFRLCVHGGAEGLRRVRSLVCV